VPDAPWPSIRVQLAAAGNTGPTRELDVSSVVTGIVYARWGGGAGTVRFALKSGAGIAEAARWRIERESLKALRAEESRRFHEGAPLRVDKAHFRHTRKGYR